jgi:hypothetical protein
MLKLRTPQAAIFRFGPGGLELGPCLQHVGVGGHAAAVQDLGEPQRPLVVATVWSSSSCCASRPRSAK